MIKCVICKDTIKRNVWGWEHGHNAQPVAEGQCCEDCNNNKVVPARLQDHFPRMSKSEALKLSDQLKGGAK